MHFLKIISLSLLALVPFSRRASDKPNVVLIFIDDMGYGDLSCYGALYNTPQIDRMAAEGMRFTQFYSAQGVCSASRAALMTGCYPNRIGIHGALFPTSKNGIHENEKTMGELFKEAGYATAIYGKWHLGHHQPFLPLQHGFDEYVGIPYSNDMWPVDFSGAPVTDSRQQKGQYPPLPLIEGNSLIKEIRTLTDQDSLTSLYTEKALDFIRRNRKKPFFLYLPHSMVHIPLGVSDKFRGKSGWSMYADVVQELDWSVGKILETLKELNLDENTIVVFTSDNGPWQNFGDHAGSAAALREAKGSSFEGGVRVPCIVRWPGNIPAGNVCNRLATTMDLFPTLAEICGGKLPSHPIDGVNIRALWQGDLEAEPRKTFYYYYQRNSLEAVRDRRWKLVLPHKFVSYAPLPVNGGFPGPTLTDSTGLALFDLYRDPGERYDVKALYPAIMENLMLIAEEARNDLGDDLTKRTGAGVRPAGQIK